MRFTKKERMTKQLNEFRNLLQSYSIEDLLAKEPMFKANN